MENLLTNQVFTIIILMAGTVLATSMIAYQAGLIRGLSSQTQIDLNGYPVQMTINCKHNDIH